MELYVKGELDALKIVFYRVLTESIKYLSLICANSFMIRTPNIESIECTLFCAMWASIKSFKTIGLDDITVPIDSAFDSVELAVRSDLAPTWNATRRIQRNWRLVISNPEYLVCRRRLMHELEILTS